MPMPTSIGPHRPLAASRYVLALMTLLATTTLHAETWTSLRGTHSVEAEMVGLWDGNVILRLGSGRRVSVKLNDLRSESRIQAQELAERLASSRSGRVKELQGQATAAAAPAPNPLPKPPPAPPYVAPKQDSKAADFLNQVNDAVADGHIRALFDALPPSYRKDVAELVKLGAQKINPTTWQSLIGTTQAVGDLIVTRQRWFLSSPRVQALQPEQADMVEGQVLTMAGLLRDGLNADAMQLEKLQTMDFGQWLAERDTAIAPHLAKLFQQLGETDRSIMVDSEKDGVAVVSIDNGGSKSKITLRLVEGYWVPKTLADGWSELVAARKKEFAEAPAGSLLDSTALIVAPITPMLEPLARARDAGQFHEAMEAIFVPAEAIASTVATMLGKNINLASRGGGMGEMGYDEMEMEMEMEMDMEMEDMEMEEEMDLDMDLDMDMDEGQ